jgi:hypothetical protein
LLTNFSIEKSAEILKKRSLAACQVKSKSQFHSNGFLVSFLLPTNDKEEGKEEKGKDSLEKKFY